MVARDRGASVGILQDLDEAPGAEDIVVVRLKRAK